MVHLLLVNFRSYQKDLKVDVILFIDGRVFRVLSRFYDNFSQEMVSLF